MNLIRNIIPSLLTSCGIFCGIISTYYENYKFQLIFMAGLFDFLDGFVARKLNIVSKFGELYDSFADWFNYGIISSVHLYEYLDYSYLAWFYFISITYRLINFTFNESYVIKNNKIYFIGIPSTMSSIILMGCFQVLNKNLVYILTITLCILLNSKILVPKITFKK